MESLAGALGVAYLAPTAEAGRFQRRPGDAVRGYALVTGEEGHLTLSLWIENGRHLNDRTGQDGFYYEVWLGSHSLGPFNTDSAGHGALVAQLDLTGGRRAWPTGAPPAVTALAEAFQDGLPPELTIRVTAEPFGGTPAGGIPVLIGKLAWIGTVGVAGANVDEALSLSGADSFGLIEAEPDPDPIVETEAEPYVAAAEAGERAPALEAEPEVPTEQSWEPATADDQPEHWASPAQEQSFQAAPEELALDEPSPHAPTREEQLAAYLDQNLVINRRQLIRPTDPHRLASIVQLQGSHPLVPRVYATGSIDGERGALTLTVRNLPSPAALGKSEATGRPWSAYRAWLIHSRTGATMAIGLLNRVWGDQWRLEVPEGLALTRFDTLLVCLGDRTDSQPRPEPIVLMGNLLE